MRDRERGFTLLHMLLLLAVVGLAAVPLLALGSEILALHRLDRTEDQLVRLKRAMVGDPALTRAGERVSFGFLGDMGRLPDSLAEVLRPGALPPFATSPARRLGAGWAGPYYPIRVAEDTIAALLDAFGRPIRYRTADTVVNGVTWDALLASDGPDGVAGTDDDIVVPIRKDETTASVSATILESGGNPAPNADVTLTFRRAGILVDTTFLADALGRVAFSDVPFGTALLRILGPAAAAPDSGILKLMPGSQVASSAGGQERVQFEMYNSGQAAIVIRSLRATYNETAFYRTIEARQAEEPLFTTLFDAVQQKVSWPGSGQLVNFTVEDTVPPVTAFLPPVSLRYVPVRVAGPNISLDTLFSPPSVIAGTIVRITDFRKTSDGRGATVSMGGVTFTIEFNDGSTLTFTTPP